MDGVVIDSEKLYSLSEKNLLLQYNVVFDESDWNYIKGCTESQFYDLVYRKFKPDIKRELLISQGRTMLKKNFTEKLEYMQGFQSLHSELKQKYSLGLVTSTSPDLVDHINKVLLIKEKFQVIITANDTKKHKPDPEPYIKAIEKLELKPRQCIVIEDSIQGILSGKASGCKVIALEGSFRKKYLSDADYIISSLSDIQNIL